VNDSSDRAAERSDAAVIAESLECPQAFAAIFDRHFDIVHGYLARRVGADGADDLTAATFVVAFERRATFRDHVSARPWLFGIATNLMRNEWRAERRALDALTGLAGTSPVASGDREPSGLGEALAELDPDHRDVLLLHAWEGFSYEEIATALGIKIGTVRSRLARGRARLRLLLAPESTPPTSTHHRREVTE
jgi:RNA polymerase sigma factor (sigma-70 family)